MRTVRTALALLVLLVPTLASARVLAPSQAARREGEKVTVQFKVKGIGTNPAGYIELYSQKAWDHPAAFFIRFPRSAEKQYKKLQIANIGDHFLGAVIRVTGKVEPIPFAIGNRPAIYVTDPAQIKIVGPQGYTPTASYQKRTVAGFTILVAPDLLARKKHAAESLAELKRQLVNVRRVLPADRLAPLLEVRIWMEWTNAKSKSAAQFSPSTAWLRTNRQNPDKANGVELSDARKFVSWSRQDQPWMVLHELAHAYHFLVLGENHAGIRAAYQQAMERKLYESVRHANGNKVRAYAATNEKEYFAELTEAYFGKNDFYPFTRADLRKHDPVGYKLMQDTWGPIRGKGRR
jgi:hypothetical protein